MSVVYNYYWDEKDSALPFKEKDICNALALVPDNATRIPPPEYDKGSIPCWSGEKWIIRHDWRQEQLYRLSDAQLTGYPTVDVDEDDLKENYTTLKPPYTFSKWDGDKWIEDTERKKNDAIDKLTEAKKKALTEANSEIELITDGIDYLEAIGESSDDYQKALKNWKLYRGQLVVMKITTGEEVLPAKPLTWEEMNG